MSVRAVPLGRLTSRPRHISEFQVVKTTRLRIYCPCLRETARSWSAGQVPAFILIAWALIVVDGRAQNLVPNPGFENFTACPTMPSQLSLVPPWSSPTFGSPDYFNACQTAPATFGVPSNGFGTEAAHTGNGYVGVRVYTPTPHDNYREYIEVSLTAPLVANATYEVSYYVSLADPFRYAIENLDAHLSVGSVGPASHDDNLALSPLVLNSTGVINNKTGWRLVSGSYTAAGGEDHLTIGNFRNDLSTVIQNVGGSCCAYYFVDDVSVVRTSCEQPPSDMVAWYTGDDTTPRDLFGLHHGSFVGDPISPLNWIVGGGAMAFFSNPQTYVVVPDHPDLDFGTGNFSIDLWVLNTAASTAGVQPILDKRAGAAPALWGYHVALFNGNLLVQLADGIGSGFTNFVSTLPVPNDGNWHFLAITVDRSSASGLVMYVDNLPPQSFNATLRSGSIDNPADLWIGARHPISTVLTFDGLFDEVEIFSRALSAVEVESIRLAGSAGKCKCRPNAAKTLCEGSCPSAACPTNPPGTTPINLCGILEDGITSGCIIFRSQGGGSTYEVLNPAALAAFSIGDKLRVCGYVNNVNPTTCQQGLPIIVSSTMACDAGENCQPRCLRWNPSTGKTEILDCECRGPEPCRAVLGAEGVECIGRCPSGKGCHRTQTIFTEPGTSNTYLDVCCDCEDVCPLQDPPLQHDPCAGFQAQYCIDGGEDDTCLPHCAMLASNYFCPPIPPYVNGCDCACAAPDSCGPISVTGVGPPYFWNNLPFYTNYLFSCVGDCPPPEVCKLFHKGATQTTYNPTGLVSALASQLPFGFVKCGCAESLLPPCEPNAAGTACQGVCASDLTCQPAAVTCAPGTTSCVITDCACIGNTCHAVFPPPVGGSRCAGPCPNALLCVSNPIINPDGSTTHACGCGFQAGYGDFDSDGLIDLRDFSRFQNCFGSLDDVPPICLPGDLEPDNDVDLADWALIQRGLSCPQ